MSLNSSNLTFAKQSKSAKIWSNVAAFTGGILLDWYAGELISEDTQSRKLIENLNKANI